MPRIRYVGTAHRRVLNSGDFKQFGVDSPEQVFDQGELTEVDPAVAGALTQHLPDEFEVEPSPSDAGWAPAFDEEGSA